jgi:prepilin signal peptidase PulO-like enzyme (type II secretory pathway)
MHMVLGALLMTAITGFLILISKGSLGIGDLHFSPLLGAAIGWYAPSLVIVAWVVASVSAVIAVFGLLATGRISMRTRIPYGPFLALGTTAAICIGAVR